MANGPSCRIWNLCGFSDVYMQMPGRWAKGGTMKTIFKYAAAVALTGALAVAAATPSEARHGRNAAAGIGFVAGALVGAAVVNNGYYGGAGYGYAPGYYAEPGYAYEEPGYAGYAYEAAPVYVEPAPTYYSGRSYYQRGPRNCIQSPASINFGACN
jgi:hypothetical protein